MFFFLTYLSVCSSISIHLRELFCVIYTCTCKYNILSLFYCFFILINLYWLQFFWLWLYIFIFKLYENVLNYELTVSHKLYNVLLIQCIMSDLHNVSCWRWIAVILSLYTDLCKKKVYNPKKFMLLYKSEKDLPCDINWLVDVSAYQVWVVIYAIWVVIMIILNSVKDCPVFLYKYYLQILPYCTAHKTVLVYVYIQCYACWTFSLFSAV